MTMLNEQALNCLRKIANGTGSDITPACDGRTLKHLVSLGYLEYRPAIRLPLEMMHYTYTVTSEGYKALRQS